MTPNLSKVLHSEILKVILPFLEGSADFLAEANYRKTHRNKKETIHLIYQYTVKIPDLLTLIVKEFKILESSIKCFCHTECIPCIT